MRRYFFYIIIATLLFTACRKDEYETPHMTMITSKTGEVMIELRGSGEISIDWGDGTPSVTQTYAPSGSLVLRTFRHNYSSAAQRAIIIRGDNITDLHCSNNQLTRLDVGKNIALKTLICYDNQLTRLDLSRNIALEFLWCWDNQLTSLDVSRNTALLSLHCDDNQLTSLDVSKNTALEFLNCRNNQLASLDLSKNIALRSLYCDDNQLTSLDVSKNTALRGLDCRNNNLQADALNALFNSLPVSPPFPLHSVIYIRDNPGAAACDRSIATDKWWTVYD